jgi:hypothetical protein
MHRGGERRQFIRYSLREAAASDVLVELLLLLIPIGLLFPFVLAFYAGFKWRGAWRIAALVPLGVLLVFFAPMVFDWMGDPTSHNLWGLVFIPISMLLCVYSVVLFLLHRKAERRIGT